VRMGSGIYVRHSDPASTRVVSAEAPLETIRARQLIESELAALAALHMKKPQVAGLREALALMEADAAAGQTPTRGDRLFHTRIAEASDNSVLLRIVGELFDERHNPLFEQLGTHFETERSWATAIAEHRTVLDAITRQSPRSARAAMARHLSRSHDRFTVNWPAEAAPSTTRPRTARKPDAKATARRAA
jgi:GntR family transcriptional regulator, transcriptional repressor for pyruvate dehydrogenase complex